MTRAQRHAGAALLLGWSMLAWGPALVAHWLIEHAFLLAGAKPPPSDALLTWLVVALYALVGWWIFRTPTGRNR